MWKAVFRLLTEKEAFDNVKIIKDYDPLQQSNFENQFLIFFKPEITQGLSTHAYQSILENFEALISKFDVNIQALSVLSGKYVQEKKIIEKNYETLNQISHHAKTSLWDSAIEKIQSLFGRETEILGGHEFLKQNASISPLALNFLVNQNNVIKIGYGCYASQIQCFGKSRVVLNGFHPYQLEHLQATNQKMIVMICASNTAWKTLRSQLVGTIMPSHATLGSFRRYLFDHQKKLKLMPVCIEHNGVHISAGPIEAVKQISLFFQHEPIKDDTLHLVKRAGLEQTKFLEILKNPIKTRYGTPVHAFEATEEYESEKALDWLKFVD